MDADCSGVLQQDVVGAADTKSVDTGRGRSHLIAVVVSILVGAVAIWRVAPGFRTASHQLSNLPAPSWPWVAVVAAAIGVSYFFAALALQAAAGTRLPLPRTVLVQLAAAAANRITPAGSRWSGSKCALFDPSGCHCWTSSSGGRSLRARAHRRCRHRHRGLRSRYSDAGRGVVLRWAERRRHAVGGRGAARRRHRAGREPTHQPLAVQAEQKLDRTHGDRGSNSGRRPGRSSGTARDVDRLHGCQ